MRKKFLVIALIMGCIFQACSGQTETIIPAAERTETYFPLLKGKRVAVFANQTSMVKETHLIDTLLEAGIDVSVIFSPEHGFRGNADAGEKVNDNVDEKTGIDIISLYGKKKAPTAEDLKHIDVILFDIQDVGVRFYTYISSLQFLMEAAFRNHKPMMILDRPNPNGFYVDGPVLNTNFKSFVGMQPVPVVYGMTIGEYAMMLAGEKWLTPESNAVYDYYRTTDNSLDTNFHFLVIKCKNYTHKSKYQLPVKPSPNLPNMASVYLYPSVCFIEGTCLSEGRGTSLPFQVIGHPSLPKNLYAFTPKPNEGAKTGKCFGETCYGWRLAKTTDGALETIDNKIQLKWLLDAYKLFNDKESFFLKNKFFNLLAGNNELIFQIKNNLPEEKIRQSWQKDIEVFKKIRKKYLLYEDFEG